MSAAKLRRHRHEWARRFDPRAVAGYLPGELCGLCGATRGEADPLFGRTLRRARELRGLALRDVATAAGVSAPHLSHLERDMKPPPGAALVVRLAEALAVDPDMLLAAAGRVPPLVLAAYRRAPKAVLALAAQVLAAEAAEKGRA